MNEVSKFIVFRGQTIELMKDFNGFWSDNEGTEYAYYDPNSSSDPNIVCGVGVFSLTKDNPLNEACAPHDFAYSSPVYQAYHTREEADHYLYELLKQIPGEAHSLTPGLFELICRQEGFHFWENPKTND